MLIRVQDLEGSFSVSLCGDFPEMEDGRRGNLEVDVRMCGRAIFCQRGRKRQPSNLFAKSRGSPFTVNKVKLACYQLGRLLHRTLLLFCRCCSWFARSPAGPLTLWPPIRFHKMLDFFRIRIIGERIPVGCPNYFVPNCCVHDLEPPARRVVSPCTDLPVAQFNKTRGRFIITEEPEDGV